MIARWAEWYERNACFIYREQARVGCELARQHAQSIDRRAALGLEEPAGQSFPGGQVMADHAPAGQ